MSLKGTIFKLLFCLINCPKPRYIQDIWFTILSDNEEQHREAGTGKCKVLLDKFLSIVSNLLFYYSILPRLTSHIQR